MKPIVTVSACVAGILALGFLAGQMLFSGPAVSGDAPSKQAIAGKQMLAAAMTAAKSNPAGSSPAISAPGASTSADAVAPSVTGSLPAPAMKTADASRAAKPVAFFGPVAGSAVDQLPPLPDAPAAVPPGSQPAPAAAPVMAAPTVGEGEPPVQRSPGSYTAIHTDQPYIALTFDDGPNPETTNKLLKILAEKGVKATFFVLGSRAEQSPEILKAMVAAGHEVANHSWNHPQLTKLQVPAVDKQIEDTNAAIETATGVRPKYLRPPYGAMSASLQRHIEDKYKMTFIYWSVDPLDWKVRDANAVYDQIMRQVRPGAIVLSHDIHPTTVAAFSRVIDSLRDKGYKFMTVSELIAQDKPAPRVAAVTPAPAAPKKKPAKPAQAAGGGAASGQRGPVNISPVPVSAQPNRPPAAVPARPPASAGIY